MPRPKPESLDLERKDLLLQEHAKKLRKIKPLLEKNRHTTKNRKEGPGSKTKLLRMVPSKVIIILII